MTKYTVWICFLFLPHHLTFNLSLSISIFKSRLQPPHYPASTRHHTHRRKQRMPEIGRISGWNHWQIRVPMPDSTPQWDWRLFSCENRRYGCRSQKSVDIFDIRRTTNLQPLAGRQTWPKMSHMWLSVAHVQVRRSLGDAWPDVWQRATFVQQCQICLRDGQTVWSMNI